MAAHHFFDASLRLLLVPSALLAGLYLPQTHAQDEWQFEVADNGRQFSLMTEQHMQLDVEGHPHVVYGKDHLYYAWHDGSAWHHETPDSSRRVGEHAFSSEIS